MQYNINSEPPNTGLKISTSADKKLSASQEIFNKLTQQINTLEKELDKHTQKLDSLSEQYLKKVHPIKLKNAELQIKMARSISEITYSQKFGKDNLERVKEVIQDLLMQAFEHITPDAELEKFYNSWVDSSYKDEQEEMRSTAKEMTAEYLKENLGIDIDFSEFEDTPEGQARMIAHIQQLMKDMEQNHEAGAGKSKTKRKLAEEQKQRDAEAVELKSLRSIYISLAKALHPDTEKDVAEKLLKEELMKKVIAAYENRDLAELLKLEMQWVHKDSEHLEKLSDDKLKLYINFLKKKVDELKDSKAQISYHPKYQYIFGLSQHAEKKANKMMQEGVEYHRNRGANYQALINAFGIDGSKKTVMYFVDDYLQSLLFENMFGGK